MMVKNGEVGHSGAKPDQPVTPGPLLFQVGKLRHFCITVFPSLR
jgi:hypothetical protein